jgi:hypothetical protein
MTGFPVEVSCAVCGGTTRIEYNSPLHGACSACRHIGVRLNTLEAAVQHLTCERESMARERDSIRKALTEMVEHYCKHSGLCCSITPEGRLGPVTPESCACPEHWKRWRALAEGKP